MSPIGETILIRPVSPPIIVIRPPEKLVIEVQCFGGYVDLFWNRDNSNLVTGLFHFREVFVAEETTEHSAGIYNVLAPNRAYYRVVVSTFHVILSGMQSVFYVAVTSVPVSF